ncbi:MAG: hypothetical protein H0V17_05710 [Deltaproteobacteria bacterium]|nr:hypothetical protein [Deltaproteobacteria bacterium]
MPHHVESDINVQRFGFTDDDQGRRLTFPRVEMKTAQGRSGPITYGAQDLLFDGLEGRLDTVRWTADAASLGAAWLRDEAGRVDIHINRIEMSRGVMLTRADRGVEIVSPHVTLSEMKLAVKGPFGRKAAPAAPVAHTTPPTLRQDRLRFLDSLSGHINVTVKVVLDLPVIGKRTLDQDLKVPIQEGSLDYRKLDESLDWLEGTFLDIQHDEDKLAVVWKVPIFGSTRDLVAWRLDQEAQTLASFGRVPVRSLADFIVAAGKSDKPKEKKGSGVLQSLSLEAIDVAISLIAPRSLDVGGGMIMFGGEEQPGMVDLKVTGNINNHGPGLIHGAIGSIDTTIKDLRIGPATITADRLHFDGLDELEVVFNGFSPERVTVVIHRVTATNLLLQLAGKPS